MSYCATDIDSDHWFMHQIVTGDYQHTVQTQLLAVVVVSEEKSQCLYLSKHNILKRGFIILNKKSLNNIVSSIVIAIY